MDCAKPRDSEATKSPGQWKGGRALLLKRDSKWPSVLGITANPGVAWDLKNSR